VLWPFWPWKPRSRADKVVESDVVSEDDSVGPETEADIAHLNAFLVKRGPELCSAVEDSDSQAIAGATSDESLPDFGWPYKTERLIGEGTTGKVFRVADLEFNRTIAIKVSHLGRGEEEGRVYQALLAREQRHVGRLEHECVVRVFRGGRLEDGRLWYAMEHVQGEPLIDYVVSHGLSLTCAVSLLASVVEAVGELHGQGIMHADLKPAHVLMTARGQPKVIDFGLARMIGTAQDVVLAGSGGSGHRSCIGGGTPGYRAPELAHGQCGDFRSDVYSLGVVLHELITGNVPAQAHEIEINVSGRCASNGGDHHASRATLPAELDAVIGKCMAGNPGDRYPTAALLAVELSRWLAGRPVTAFENTLSYRKVLAYRAARLALRHRKTISLVGLVACLAAAVLGLALKMTSTGARDQALIARERQRADDETLRADAERERVETQQHREGIVAARELLAQRRIDDVSRALARVPFARRAIECELLARLTAESPAPRKIVGSHDWGITAILGDTRCVVSAGHDGRLIVWNLQTGDAGILRAGRWSQPLRRYLRPFEDGTSDANATAIIVGLAWLQSGRSFASVNLDGVAMVWTVDEGQERELLRHSRPLLSVAVSSDGRTIACGDDAGTLIICNVDGDLKSGTALDGGAVSALATAGQERWWVGHESGAVRLVDSNGVKVAERTLQGPIWQLATTPRSNTVAVGCQRPSISVLTFDTNDRALQLSAELKIPLAESSTPGSIHAVQYSPAGDHLLALDDLGRLASFAVHDGSVEFVRDDQEVHQLSAAAAEHWPAPLRRRAAGIAFTDHDQAFATAAGDTLVKLWQMKGKPWVHELQVRDNPRVAFSPASDRYLWIGDTAGKLTLVDVQTGRACETVQTGPEPVTALATAGQANLIATAGGKSVHFWREHNGHIEQQFTFILSRCDIDSLAMTSDGNRLAIQTWNGAIELWDIHEHRIVASREFPNAAGGRVAFRGAGDRLALLEGTSAFILSTTDLSTLTRFQMAVDEGTALAWHPNKREMVFVGDAHGRVTSRPEMDPATPPEVWTAASEIVDLAITPDGKRVLAATSTGRIVVFDHERLGPVLSFDIPPAPATSPTISMALSRTGRFLAASRENGTVCILRLADADMPQPEKVHQWFERVCCKGSDARNIRLHPGSVDIDEQGNLHALYLQTGTDAETAETSWWLVLGRETRAGWKTRILRDYGPLPPRGVDSLDRSHTLRIDQNRWFVVAKLDVDATRERATSPHLIIGSTGQERDTIDDRIPLAIEPQSGFDPFLVLHDGDSPSVAHFSHAGNYLLLSSWSGSSWTTTQLGRQGDGFRFHAVAAPGRWHFLFRPNRFDGDHGLPVLLDVLPISDESQPSESRSHFSDLYRSTPLGLALSESGEPTVLYRTGTLAGPTQLWLARRQGTQWRQQVVFEREPVRLAASNLIGCPDGVIAFTAANETDGQLWLVTIAAGSIKVELVWQDTCARAGVERLQLGCALRFTCDGEPVMLVSRDAPNAGYIRIFRGQ
jgi:WD40 repeat protein